MLVLSEIAFSLPAATVVNRYFEFEGRYSYILPEKWHVVEKQNLPFAVAVGPERDAFYPSVFFNKEIVDIEFDEYIKKVVDEICINNPLISELSMDKFQNVDDINGVKITFKNEINKVCYKQIVYLYSNGHTKFGISCTSSLNSIQINETYFDQIATSFVFAAD